MATLKYNYDAMGPPLRSSYVNTPESAARKIQSLRGRPRNALTDDHPTVLVDLSFVMSPSQFSAWQLFWGHLGNGVDWFFIDLTLGLLTSPADLSTYEVHAKNPFSAALNKNHHWNVTLRVEVVE